SHTVTVTDALVSAATVTSPVFVVEACPTDPGISLSVAECGVPGGKGTITATFSNLGVGREYQVTITGNGSAVPGYVDPLIVTSASAPVVFGNLAPSVAYTVTIIDLLAPTILDAKTLSLSPCPMTPSISLALQ